MFPSFLVKIFFLLTVSSLLGLIYITNENNKFFNNPLSGEILAKIDSKKYELEVITKEKFHIEVDIPIYVDNSIPSHLFGLASYDTDGKIAIYLNKNRFKENEKYMIEEVLPHEFAHALMFVFGDFSSQNGGHPKKWEMICNKIGGKKCDRFVNGDDILIEKIGF